MAARILTVWLTGVVFAGIWTTSLVAEEPAVPCFSAGQEANQRIWETLRKPLPEQGLEFIQTPLEEIIQVLRDEYKIEILVDRNAFKELGIDETQPVDVNLRSVSLQAALKLILSELKLTYVVANEVLLITTREKAETMLALCVYPVCDLLVPTYKPTEADKKLRLPAELIPLANILTTTVASDTWAENGKGESSISGMQPGLLVVSQSQAVHEQIREALAAIRSAKQFAQENQPAPEATAESGMEGGDEGIGGAMPLLRPRHLRQEHTGDAYGGGSGFGFGGGYGRQAPPSEKAAAADPFAE